MESLTASEHDEHEQQYSIVSMDRAKTSIYRSRSLLRLIISRQRSPLYHHRSLLNHHRGLMNRRCSLLNQRNIL